MKRSGPMKRSPLRRGTKRMKQRSKTNSRPSENIALRERYREANPECELLKLLIGCGQEAWEFHRSAWGDVGESILDVNHIFSVGMRPDYVWNLITLCRTVHDWFHKCPTDGRIACLRVKLRKGEFDAGEFQRVIGKCPIGWLENERGSTAFFERMRLECLELARRA